MKKVIAVCAMLSALASGGVLQVRSVSSFNEGWVFNRYGSMPDGSVCPEPGAPELLYKLSASSEETAKGNLAKYAFDNEVGTRWCVKAPSSSQWVAVDLLEPLYIKSVKIDWEFDREGYKADILVSDNGKDWQKKGEVVDKAPLDLNGEFRFLKIGVIATPPALWASLREIELIGQDGKRIKNIKPLPEGVTTPDDPACDDSGWRHLNLPHDWAIEGPFRYDLEGNTGKLPWKGIGWYRKHFNVPASDKGRRIYIDFDGVMANAKVWCNGHYVGGWPYGYQGFRLDLTPYLNYGGENLIAVRADTENWGSRWYPGAGIYRNVRLVKTAPVHVCQWGTYITTPEVSDEAATVRVQTEIENNSEMPSEVEVEQTIYKSVKGGTGDKVADGKAGKVTLAPGDSQKVATELTVKNPVRWDINNPALYICRTIIRCDGDVVDEFDTVFGIRTIEFKVRDGFWLNGRRVQLKGVCKHHDLGALGAAMNRRALQRQLEIMQSMGCNAIRTSHNPPSPELLELCDRMGFGVMCEAFDCWVQGKKAHDYSVLYQEWHKKDLEAMVKHFVNHPSIIIWSTGNEVAEQGTLNPAKELRDIVNAVDPTRPVSCGVWTGAGKSPFRKGVDVFGLNYGADGYGWLLTYPGNEKLPFFASESSSCISSRCEYFFGMKRSDFQITSYDIDAPGWGCIPDKEFEALERNPAFAGEFVWTGIDYIGEPTPYNSDMSNLLNIHDKDPVKIAKMKKELEELGKIRTPSRSSYFGIVDLAGFPKDRYYLYQSLWRPELPMVHILPHWNWPDRVGKVVPVHVYTSGDEAELFLNGKSLGRKKNGQYEYRLRWDKVVYQPGELKAIAYKDGKKWAETVVKTTGAPVGLQMQADRPTIAADGKDLAFITVKITDKEGLTVPTADNLVKFKVSGPGEVVAVDNGDPTSFEPFQASQHKAFHGLVLVIVKARKGEPGAIRVSAEADGLKSGTVEIRSR